MVIDASVIIRNISGSIMAMMSPKQSWSQRTFSRRLPTGEESWFRKSGTGTCTNNFPGFAVRNTPSRWALMPFLKEATGAWTASPHPGITMRNLIRIALQHRFWSREGRFRNLSNNRILFYWLPPINGITCMVNPLNFQVWKCIIMQPCYWLQ